KIYRGGAAFDVSRVERAFDVAKLLVLFGLFLFVRAENYRRRRELIEHENQNSDQQNQELHRDFQERAHQKRRASLIHRFRRQEPLNLALITAEIAEHQKKSADQTRPDRVFFV